MNFIDIVWHLVNFAAPALLLGMIGSAAAKLLWSADARATSWRSLCGSAAASSFIASVVGLVITGRDGKMITYAAMVLACASSLWWNTRRRS